MLNSKSNALRYKKKGEQGKSSLLQQHLKTQPFTLPSTPQQYHQNTKLKESKATFFSSF